MLENGNSFSSVGHRTSAISTDDVPAQSDKKCEKNRSSFPVLSDSPTRMSMIVATELELCTNSMPFTFP